MIQAVLRVQQSLGLTMGVRVLLGRLRRRGVVPETGETRTPETKRLAGWEWLLPAGGGSKSSHIDFGGGYAAAKKAKKGSSELRATQV